MNSMEKKEVKAPTKEEDDKACLYAMLLCNFQVFPPILNAAIDLNLFDIISKLSPSGSYLSVPEIASQLPAAAAQHPDLHNRLDRMLRVLASFSVLNSTTRTVEDGRVERLYGLSLVGKCFIKDETESLAFFSNLTCHPTTVQVLLKFKETFVDGGTDLFNKVYGKSAWEILEKDTQLSHTFNKAMAGIAAMQMRKYLEVYDGFEGVPTLVDVGGGTGQCLKMIISKYPNIKGINFDLPQVIQHAPPYPGIEHIGGDMHESVPNGDAIMIKSTCHNWSDEKCVALLKNCYKALPENGKVIIMDLIMPEEPDSTNASKLVSILDSSMFSIAGGKERTKKEFDKLCKDSGFSSCQVVCRALEVHGVIEFYK